MTDILQIIKETNAAAAKPENKGAGKQSVRKKSVKQATMSRRSGAQQMKALRKDRQTKLSNTRDSEARTEYQKKYEVEKQRASKYKI